MGDLISDLYNEQRKTALGAFRKFLKECAQNGFTVRQFEIIGMLAHDEVTHLIAINNLKSELNNDLFRLLEESDALPEEYADTQ